MFGRKKKQKAKEKSYRLTVKGFLAMKTDMLLEFDDVWKELYKFVKNQAKENGCDSGLPCIVFTENGGGGECVTVNVEK